MLPTYDDFLIRRFAQAILVLFIVTVITLALVHLFPGGPIRAILGPRATVAQVAYYNRLYGFDQPFYLLLNVAVGGSWPGPPSAPTVLRATAPTPR